MAPEIRAKLQALRLSFAAGQSVQDWLASWWSGLALEDRRMVLALSGLDDSEGMGRRNWHQFGQEQKEAVLLTCKRWGRLLEAVRWA